MKPLLVLILLVLFNYTANAETYLYKPIQNITKEQMQEFDTYKNFLNENKSNVEKIPKVKNFTTIIKSKTPIEKVVLVNNFVNEVSYTSDIENYSINDYWANLQEFFTKGGDCEDYVIAKYHILEYLGIKEKNMKILIVKDVQLNIVHAVLNVKVGNIEYTLDNQTNEVTSTKKYQVYYALDKSGIYTVGKLYDKN